MRSVKHHLITFLVGFLVGTAGYWTFRDGPLATKVANSAAVSKAVDALQSQALDRAADKVKEQMQQSGQASLAKAGSVTPVADNLLSDLVKAKIAADPMTSQAGIKVDVTNGLVELRGSASTYQQVARAMQLAVECDAASGVVSKVTVKGS